MCTLISNRGRPVDSERQPTYRIRKCGEFASTLHPGTQSHPSVASGVGSGVCLFFYPAHACRGGIGATSFRALHAFPCF
jgi:hypothetical protein